MEIKQIFFSIYTTATTTFYLFTFQNKKNMYMFTND